MKATSKLISVVLILALCLSIFTISASADVVIGTSEEVTYSGSGDDGGEGLGLPAGTNDKIDAPAGTAATVEVATAADLDKELKDGATSIKLMDSFTYEGPLTLGAVTIDFNNKTLTINGDGAAAVIASGAVFKGGQLAVTGAVTDDQGNKTGFDSVASGLVTFRTMNMNLAGDTVLGSVSVVSGSFNKDVSANIASGSEKAAPDAAEGEQTADTRFVVQESAAKPAADEKADEQSEQKPDEKVEEKVEEKTEGQPDEKVEEKTEEQADQKADVQVEEKTEEQTNEEADKQEENSDNKEQDASFNNEDPVTVTEPTETVIEDETRVSADQQAAMEAATVTVQGEDPVSGTIVIVSGVNLPEDLTVVVKPMEGVITNLEEGEEVALAIDITIYDKEGNVYEPWQDEKVAAVDVMIRNKDLGNLEEGEALVLYHVVNDVPVPVSSAEKVEGEDAMTFSTTSFSPFVVLKKPGQAGSALNGSTGEAHNRQIKIKNLGSEIYINDGTTDLLFEITGGMAPSSISIVDPEYANSGDANYYKAGYLLWKDDYDFDFDPLDPTTPTPDPLTVTIKKEALANAPEGKWCVVFWFQDTTKSAITPVYMIQPITIVNKEEIKGVGANYDDETNTFYAEKCDYNPIQVFLTADLESFTITRGGTTYASYDRNSSTKKMMVRIDGKNKTVNASEYFSVSDFYADDAVGHEYIAGKTLQIYDSLVKKLPFGSGFVLTVNQRNKTAPEHAKTGVFNIDLTPGITVADGLTDYIKGRNTWIKFIACAPIDYDSDGTLAIWIGGQKISHDYYSISNDHQTLWIYRNLLDQLKSNNSYTLTARLWEWKNTDSGKVKQTWYPATASFNILAAGSTSYRSPKTGDESNVALWAAVLLLSGGAVVALVPKKKKSK